MFFVDDAYEWWNLMKKKRIRKIKVEKCVAIADYVEEDRERGKRKKTKGGRLVQVVAEIKQKKIKKKKKGINVLVECGGKVRINFIKI